LALRAEHHAVDDESLLISEELGESDRSVLAFEGVVFGNLAAEWQCATEGGDALDVTAKFNLLGEEGVACFAILCALVGKVGFVLCCEFCCRREGGFVGHSVLLGGRWISAPLNSRAFVPTIRCSSIRWRSSFWPAIRH